MNFGQKIKFVFITRSLTPHANNLQNHHKLVCEFFEGDRRQIKNMQITFSSVKYSKTKNLIGNSYMKLSSIRNPTLSDKHTPSLEKVSTTFERKKVES